MTDIASTTDRAASPPLPYDVPSLEGRRVLLRPVLPADHEWLYRQAIDARVGVRWRFHGMTSSIDRFLSVFHAGADLSPGLVARAEVRARPAGFRRAGRGRLPAGGGQGDRGPRRAGRAGPGGADRKSVV